LKHVLTGLADIVFPPACLTCGAIFDHPEGLPFCPSCLSKIKFITSPLCVRCGMPFIGTTGTDHDCGDCIISTPMFSSARAVGHYEDILLDAIHDFKYKGKSSLGKILGRWMSEYNYPSFNISSFTLIIPVPLHPKRLKERGFNQSVLLARELSGRFSIPLDIFTLKRQVCTEPQVHLGKKERESNVRNAFIVSDSKKISNQKIILVDDVYTTGSTVKECARILLKEGALTVGVLTLARAI